MTTMSAEQVTHVVSKFFTSGVDLPDAPHDLTPGIIWWEERDDGYRYPWRITGPRVGYPCGEPVANETKR